MGCYIRIFGDFHPGELIAAHPGALPPDSSHQKGDPIRKTGRTHKEACIQYHITSKKFDDYQHLIAHASHYLRQHHQWLAAIRKDPRVQEAVLDIGLAQQDSPAYYRRLPLLLVRLAAICGLEIELSLYQISK